MRVITCMTHTLVKKRKKRARYTHRWKGEKRDKRVNVQTLMMTRMRVKKGMIHALGDKRKKRKNGHYTEIGG